MNSPLVKNSSSDWFDRIKKQTTEEQSVVTTKENSNTKEEPDWFDRIKKQTTKEQSVVTTEEQPVVTTPKKEPDWFDRIKKQTTEEQSVVTTKEQPVVTPTIKKPTVVTDEDVDNRQNANVVAFTEKYGDAIAKLKAAADTTTDVYGDTVPDIGEMSKPLEYQARYGNLEERKAAIEKLSYTKPPKYNFSDLDKNDKWLKAAATIYKYENKKDFDPEKEGQSLSDWFKNRHSEFSFDLGSMIADLSNIDEWSDDVKKAWVDSLQIYDDTGTDIYSVGRAIKNVVQDYTFLPSMFATFGVAAVVRLLGGKAASAAGRLVFKQRLKDLLAKKVLKTEVPKALGKSETKKNISRILKGEVTKAEAKEIAKQGGLQAIKEKALGDVKKSIGRLAFAEGTLYGGAAALTSENLDVAVGRVIDKSSVLKSSMADLHDRLKKDGILEEGLTTEQFQKAIEGTNLETVILKSIQEDIDAGNFRKEDVDYLNVVITALGSGVFSRAFAGLLTKFSHKFLSKDKRLELASEKIIETTNEFNKGIRKNDKITTLPSHKHTGNDGDLRVTQSHIADDVSSETIDKELLFMNRNINTGESGTIDIAENVSRKVIDNVIDSGKKNGLDIVEEVHFDPATKRKQLKVTKNSNILEEDLTSKIVEKVVPDGSGSIVSRSIDKVTDVIATANTKAGRGLTVDAALPKDIIPFARNLRAARKDFNLEAASDAKVLRKLKNGFRIVEGIKGRVPFRRWKKDKNATTFTDEEINTLLEGGTLKDKIVPEELFSHITKMQNSVLKNERIIERILGLEPQTLGSSWKDGQVYYTRTMQAATDPRWKDRVNRALKDNKGKKEFVEKIVKARDNIKDTYNLSDEDTYRYIDSLIEHVADPEGVGGRRITGLTPKTKTLKERKDLTQDVLTILGELREPGKRYINTIANQNRVVATLEYLDSINRFIKENDGKTIKLGGFFNWLPRTKAKLSKPIKIVGKDRGPIDNEQANLADLNELLMRGHGSTSQVIEDVFTSPVIKRVLERGLDIFDPNYNPNWFIQLFGGAASYVQATQTAFDHGAYIVNTSGALQSLLANGYGLQLGFGKKLFDSVDVLLNQASKNFGDEARYLDKLKREDIIDTDATGEMLREQGRLITGNPKNFVSKTYRWTTDKFGKIYGQPDNFVKVAAHLQEMENLKRMFPKLADETPEQYNDKIFKIAADRIRKTMQSYSASIPLAQYFARIPLFGNYLLFPTELVRTTKGQLFVGAEDTIQGASRVVRARSKEERKAGLQQVRFGLTRSAFANAMLFGTYPTINYFNAKNHGITEETERAIDASNPPWTGKRIWTEIEDPKKKDKDGRPILHKGLKQLTRGGDIFGRYRQSANVDMQDWIKNPVSRFVAAMLGKAGLTDAKKFEIARDIEGASLELLKPYFSPKMLAGTLIGLAINENLQTGRPIYSESDTPLQRAKKAISILGRKFLPGSVDGLLRWIDANEAEAVEAYKQAIAQKASGFPITTADMEAWALTGAKPQTVNISKTFGYVIGNDVRKVNQNIKDFNTWLREQKTGQITLDEIVNKFEEQQNKKLEDMKTLGDRIQILRDITWTDYKGNKRTGLKPIEILSMVSKNFEREPNELVVLNTILKKHRKRIFVPDNLLKNKRFIETMKNLGFTGRRGTLDRKVIKTFAELARKYKKYRLD